MSAPSSSDFSSPPPLVLPVPGRLFFLETLPLDNMPPAAVEDAVLLSLESHAPLPPEQLAYGWRVDAARKNIFYYAAMREHLRQSANGLYDAAVHLVPDFVLAPKCEPGVWRLLATPQTLTAVRVAAGASFPEEIRSWELPADGSENLFQRAGEELEKRRQSLDGAVNENILYWHGATVAGRGKSIVAEWRTKNGKAETAAIPVDAIWHADVRERRWLAQMRRTRTQRNIVRNVLAGGLLVLLFVALAGAGVFYYKKTVDVEVARVGDREKMVEDINAKNDLVIKLDQLVAGQVPFFDALATLNHFRPMSVLFTRTEIDGNRQIQINGTGTEISQITDYVDKLKNSGAFKQVTMPQINTAQGRTTFTLKLTVGNLNVSRTTPLPEAIDASAAQAPVTDQPPANDDAPPPPSPR